MLKKIFLEGETSIVTLSNVREMDAFDFNIEDINEKADIVEIMDQLDAYAESSELDLTTDSKKFTVMNPDMITYMGTQDENSQELEVSLDTFMLKNSSFFPVKELLEHANLGDLIYLRKTEGTSNWEFSLEVEKNDEKLSFSYFDCADALDTFNQYDLLSENYYNVLCDTILPQSLESETQKAVMENFDIEPQIVYAELYKVTQDRISGEKVLERLEVPGYYFLDKTRTIDE